jgi:hypothetical protein
MPKPFISAVSILLLSAVDWLAFHDLSEPHTVRDYMTLAASLLVLLNVISDVLPNAKGSAPRN